MDDRIVIMNGIWSQARRQLWGRALHRLEHQYPLYNRRHFGGVLKPPVLDLDDGPARVLRRGGDPYLCTSLFVPLAMAEKQPWRMVEEALLQQMVHQYIYQELKCLKEEERRRHFQRFCERPKVRLDLAMSFGLPDFAAPVTRSPEEERLLQRIHRLLALSESPNPHEADSALREAQRLMLQHNIDLSLCADPGKQRYGLRHLGRPLRHVTDANRTLRRILTEHFFVKNIWAYSFDVHKKQDEGNGHILEILGTPANLDMASHVYTFLTQTAARLWRAQQKSLGQKGEAGRADYIAGVYLGFESTLKAQARRNQVAGLVWLGDKGLDEFYGEIYPRTLNLKDARQRKQSALFLSGVADGRLIQLHRPIAERGPLQPGWPAAPEDHQVGQG